MDVLPYFLFIAICFIAFLSFILILISQYRKDKERTASSLSRMSNDYKKKLKLTSQEKKLLYTILRIITPYRLLSLDICRERLIMLFFGVYRAMPILPPEDQLLNLFIYCGYELRKKDKLFIPFTVMERDEIIHIELLIADSVKQLLKTELRKLPELTFEEEKYLNTADKDRWEVIRQDIIANYSDSSRFYEGIKAMERFTSSIVTRRNLYYGVHYFMVDKDKVLSLKFYLHYLHIGSESETFKFRPIHKQNQKILFETETQSDNFQEILKRYTKKKDINKAFADIEQLFIKKRKKVILDENAILSAKEDLAGVVDLLNEYLEDDEPKDKITLPVMEKPSLSLSTNIKFNVVQTEFLGMFASESYIISLGEVDVFANSKGVFKSQLIDGINDLCYDTLDDMLIEEDDSRYILNEKYYKQIISD